MSQPKGLLLKSKNSSLFNTNQSIIDEKQEQSLFDDLDVSEIGIRKEQQRKQETDSIRVSYDELSLNYKSQQDDYEENEKKLR